jgi:hypothetical protein
MTLTFTTNKQSILDKYLLSYYCNNVNTFKFNELFSSCNVIVLEKLCKFIKIINMKVVNVIVIFPHMYKT